MKKIYPSNTNSKTFKDLAYGEYFTFELPTDSIYKKSPWGLYTSRGDEEYNTIAVIGGYHPISHTDPDAVVFHIENIEIKYTTV